MMENANKAELTPPAPQPDAPGAALLDEEGCRRMRDEIINRIRTCYDPEIPVNIYDLGLIYEIKVEPNGFAAVQMTLTSPACPSVYQLPGEVEDKTRGVPGVNDCRVELVWQPPWTKDMMSEAARLQLGLD